MQEVVRKVLLDHVSLVATADNELIDPVLAVVLHDVPNDRTTTNLDHRFGSEMPK